MGHCALVILDELVLEVYCLEKKLALRLRK